VDLTFWVIQAVLLAPVLVMAASAGMEEREPRRGSPRSGARAKAVAVEATPKRGTLDRVAVAVSGLSQFTVEQQARLVLLRRFVQDAKLGYGTLRDDLMPDTPTADDEGTPGADTARRPPRRTLRRPTGRQLAMACGALLVVVGLVGIVRTNIAMDDLVATATSAVTSPSMASRLLPGVIASPAKYLSAVNSAGGSSSSASGVDPLYLQRFLWLKQAMDRWEALVGFGLALILFVSKAAHATESEETSVASDAAPFLMVLALLFAALSFFELP